MLIPLSGMVMIWKREKTESYITKAHLFLLAAGILMCMLSDAGYQRCERFVTDKPAACILEVMDLTGLKEDRAIYDCRLTEVNGEDVGRFPGTRVRLTIYNVNEEQREITDNIRFIDPVGRVVSSEIVLSRATGKRNPGGFDYNRYLRGKGIGLVAGTNSLKIQENGSRADGIKRKLLEKRWDYMDSLDMSEEMKGVVSGILFGDTSSIDEELYDDFKRNGTAHILAVSGLHVGILYRVLRKLLGKGDRGTAITVLILLCYGCVTLWAVPVTRAILMVIVSIIADRLERRYDLLCCLMAVAFVLALQHPYCIFQSGFQMSFLAVSSMSIIGERLSRKMDRRLAYILAVQIGTIPYIAYTYNYVSLLAMFINIPVVYILSLTVPIALTGFGLFMMLGSCLITERSVEGLISILVYINKFFGNISLFSPDVVSPSPFVVVFVYFLTFYICSETFEIWKNRRVSFRHIPVRIAAVICVLCSILSSEPFQNADIVMVDVGQGDAVHFRFDPGRRRIVGLLPVPFDRDVNVIIDGGGTEDYNIGKKTLKPYFLRNGVRKVDLAYATHLHTDHYKGLQELAKEDMVRELKTEGCTGDKLLIGPDTKAVLDGKVYRSGGITHSGATVESDSEDRIEIIYPDVQDPDTDDENRNSLIFKVYIKSVTVLITGDLGEEGERALVEKYRGTDVLDCDILKVCHHGSKYSSSPEFLKAVSPKIALIGVGRNNTYGHPAPETLERLKDCGAKVYRTDENGAVGIIIKGSRIEIDTMIE